MKWNDENRFSQDGYSSPTIFPLEENYTDERLFLEDLTKAEIRDTIHKEWVLDELNNWTPYDDDDDEEY